jgi:hypothetical protein
MSELTLDTEAVLKPLITCVQGLIKDAGETAQANAELNRQLAALKESEFGVEIQKKAAEAATDMVETGVIQEADKEQTQKKLVLDKKAVIESIRWLCKRMGLDDMGTPAQKSASVAGSDEKNSDRIWKDGFPSL